MKIIVVSSKDKNVDDLYTIVVLDGADVVHSEEVSTIKHRDATVWKLADLYGVVDIEMKHEKAIPKFAEIPSIPVLEESEADVFFEENCFGQDFISARRAGEIFLSRTESGG